MVNLFAKLKSALSLEFQDKKIEAEYNTIKSQNYQTNLKAVTLFILILNILWFISSGKAGNWTIFYVTIASTILTLFLGIAQIFTKKYQILILIMLFGFQISRITALFLRVHYFSNIGIYYFGYIYGCVQIYILSQFKKIYFKILTVLVFLGVRYGLWVGFDSTGFDVISWIRFIISEAFVLIVLYGSEKTERRVFQNFFEGREELMKFKELLADSLPQSVIILDQKIRKLLFANNTFLSSFDTDESSGNLRTELIDLDQEHKKIHLNMLQIDLSTLREMGIQHQEEITMLNSQAKTSFFIDFIQRIVDESLIHERTLSANAFYQDKEKQKTFQVNFKRVKWDRVDAIAVILNDTTYQENLVALKVANNNKDQIIATVSHELRTPLHGIIGLLEIAETKVKDEEVLEHLSLCKDNAHLLSSLVNSLLDLHQLSTGKLKLNAENVDIMKLLNSVVQLFKFQCDKKNITLLLEVNPDVPEFIITDESRFKQILINLIGNAIKFTFRGGVRVKICQDPKEKEYLLVSVRDTGIGIKEEDFGKLFKIYGKLESTTSVNKHGVGLGLTIASSLVSLLNGKPPEKGIEVASEYGVGSKFYFKIYKSLKSQIDEGTSSPSPLNFSNFIQEKQEDSVADEYSESLPNNTAVISKIASYQTKINDGLYILNSNRYSEAGDKIEILTEENKEDSMIIPPSQKRLLGSKGDKEDLSSSRECVLVVDDNPFNMLVARSLLRDIGLSVRSASSGQEAIAVVRECAQEGVEIKIIFLDCQMPIMDGYETARNLTAMMEKREVPRVPIFAWTANTAAEDIKRCYESGMTGYLSKPTTKENVLQAIPK